MFWLSVVSQGGGPGAGSRPRLPVPAARNAAAQEGASVSGHGLPLCAPCPGLGPDSSQCPQSSVQARIRNIPDIIKQIINNSLKCSIDDLLFWFPKFKERKQIINKILCKIHKMYIK